MWTAIIEGRIYPINRGGLLAGPTGRNNIEVTNEGNLLLTGLGLTLRPSEAPVELEQLGVRLECATSQTGR